MYPTADRAARDPITPGMLSGAFRAAQAVARCMTIFHGPQGCQENLYAEACFVHEAPEYPEPAAGEPFLPSTVLTDSDLIMGPEDKLARAATGVAREYRPDLIIAFSSDAAEIIGEDAKNLVQRADEGSDGAAGEAAGEAHRLWVDTASFKGSWVDGYAAVLAALTALMTETPVRPLTANLLGVAGDELGARADIAELRRMLRRVGAEVNAVLLCHTPLAAIRGAPAASLNVVVAEELGLPVAQAMERRFKTPYLVATPPYGLAGAARFLDEVAAALGLEENARRVNEQETRAMGAKIRSYSGFITVPMRASVCGEPSFVAGLAGLLSELGVYVPVVALRTPPGPSAARVVEDFTGNGECAALVEPEHADYLDALRDCGGVDYIFGSAMEQFVAADVGATLVECTYPAVRVLDWDEPTLGFCGAAAMARRLGRAFFKQVM